MKTTRHILIAALFTCLHAVHCLAQPAYVLDPGFKPESLGERTPSAAAVQAGGKIVVAGPFAVVDGVRRFGLARLNLDGTLDPTFTPPDDLLSPDDDLPHATSGDPYSLRLRLQSDQRILLLLPRPAPSNEYEFVRLNADGRIESRFPAPLYGGWMGFTPFTCLPSGQILVHEGGRPPLRLNADGSLDTTFKTEAVGMMIAVQADGRLILVPDDPWDNPLGWLVRLNPDGGLDKSFTPPTLLRKEGFSLGSFGFAAVLQPDAKIVVAGPFGRLGGTQRNQVARLHPNGELDLSFNPDAPEDSVVGLTQDRSGAIHVIRCNPSFNATVNGFLLHWFRLNSDGTEWRTTRFVTPPDFVFDLTFGGPVGSSIIGFLPDGGFVVQGLWGIRSIVKEPWFAHLVRVAPDGNVDWSFFNGLGTDGSRLKPIPIWRSSAFDATGRFTGTIGCLPGWNYRVEDSADLKQWDTVATGTSAGESVPFADTAPPGTARRFYRVVKE